MVVLPLPEPPDERDAAAGADREVEVADERLLERAVAEGEAADLEVALELRAARSRRRARAHVAGGHASACIMPGRAAP